jgi:hypothetical protein
MGSKRLGLLRDLLPRGTRVAVLVDCVQTIDGKKRNRHETRTVAVFNARPAVAGTEWQPNVEPKIQAFARGVGRG